MFLPLNFEQNEISRLDRGFIGFATWVRHVATWAATCLTMDYPNSMLSSSMLEKVVRTRGLLEILGLVRPSHSFVREYVEWCV